MFFDTEFTGLRANTELLSIGIIIGKRFFYGEIMGVKVDKDTVGEDTFNFLSKEVIPGLTYGKLPTERFYEKTSVGTLVIDNKFNVAKRLHEFIFEYVNVNPKHKICPVSDVMYYDMILLMDLLHSCKPTSKPEEEMMKRVLDAVSPAGIDIHANIMDYCMMDAYEAFDINREELLIKLNSDSHLLIAGKKHNALYDAKIIKALHDAMSENYI